MKKYLLILLLMAGAVQAQQYTAANLKTFFDTASVSTMTAFRDSLTSNWLVAWQDRFGFTNKAAYLAELGKIPGNERSYFTSTLTHWIYSKEHPELRDSVPIDHSGFALSSDDPTDPNIASSKTKIHTDWVFIPSAPYIILASVWFEKETKKGS